MKFFHYLTDQQPGVGTARRMNDRTVSLMLCLGIRGVTFADLDIDVRDQRVLIVIEGELLWESIPKAGDILLSEKIAELTTNAEHLRTPRFGTPWYQVEEKEGKRVARLDLMRHFLLLPCGNMMFCRVRDGRSLGPMYVFIEVRKNATGPSVVWRNSSY